MSGELSSPLAVSSRGLVDIKKIAEDIDRWCMRQRTWIRHPPFDLAGRDIRVGDWVRVVSVPESIARMPRDTKRAFSRAVGKTFQVEAFDESGCAELDLTGKVGCDTIWIEPFCVTRFRRPRKRSVRFRQNLAMRRQLDRPRWSLGYVARYCRTDNPATLVEQLLPTCINHGYYVVARRREIHGTIFAEDDKVSSKMCLQQLREQLNGTDLFVSLQLTRVRLWSVP